MSSSAFRCFWKIFKQLTAPVRGYFKDALVLILAEFIKFSMILLLAFAVGYCIFYLWNSLNGNQIAVENTIKSERLSDGLMENGSFSKYPYVVDLPSRASAESFKANKKVKSREKQVGGSGQQ